MYQNPKPLTVAELIDELRTLPQELEVVTLYDNGCVQWLCKCHVHQHEYTNGNKVAMLHAEFRCACPEKLKPFR